MPDERGIVVVAEDDEDLRLLCRTVLEHDGFQIVEVTNGSDLAAALSENEARVLLLDVHLGDDNGIDIARELSESRPDLPIIFFSGSAQLYGSEAEEFAAAVISKPFQVEELSETVARLARRP
ncbi:MAG: response regulator [Gaiellales bacterium]